MKTSRAMHEFFACAHFPSWCVSWSSALKVRGNSCKHIIMQYSFYDYPYFIPQLRRRSPLVPPFLLALEFPDTAPNSPAPHRIAQHCTEFPGTAPHCPTPHRIPRHRTTLPGTAPTSPAPHRIARHRTEFPGTASSRHHSSEEEQLLR